jgi:flagellar biosynthetic protein FliR
MTAPVFNIEYILAFTFVLIRMSAMLVMIPVVGERSVPMRIKAGLALLISLLIFPAVRMEIPQFQGDAELTALAVAMAAEALIGTVLGFTARLVFAGIRFAGDMIGIQMGLSIVNVIDPTSSTQSSIIAEFQYLFAALIYLSVDAHHFFIQAVTDSYRIMAPFGFPFSASLMQSIVMLSRDLFVIAVKICAPVMAVLLFCNVALAVVARTVPQINVFIVGMPLQIAAGLIILGLTVPVFVAVVQRTLGHLNMQIQALMRLMSS